MSRTDPAARPINLDELRATPLFEGLSDQDLARLATTVERQYLAPGEYLVREGEVGDAMFVVVSGELEVTKRAGATEQPLAVVGPGAIQGEIAAMAGLVRTASVRAVAEVEVLRIPREGLLALLEGGPETALTLLRTALERLRGLESFAREREKLAALGTLAAGLAHELNNPAAAIRRSVAALAEAIAERDRLHPPHELIGVHPDITRVPTEPLARADAIDEVLEIVSDSGTAAALVDAGWSADQLRHAFEGMDPEVARDAAAWLAATARIDALLSEVRTAGERISEIVGAVKSYTYLDQAPIQRIDVRAGLDNTLVILRPKLGTVDVTRHYASDLPEIEAYGSELNQVWTNLVDNAVDAVEGRGAIDIYADPTPEGGVQVKICDTGPGIPPEIQQRLFEPFFTTKAPGVGTGLGLPIVYSVLARHGARIEVESKAGEGTCFIVTLPPRPPGAGSEAGSTGPE
ncbi:MAG TPA: ATP-binding protein [candidate division Zixibacteria bacterium]|nr:ATP-binding protein [candidate division Zixibacteria bacterium]